MKRFSIIGAGGGGLAIAHRLIENNCEVLVYDKDQEKISKLKDTDLMIYSKTKNTVHKFNSTNNLKDIFEFSNFIFISITTNNILSLTKEIVNYLNDDMILFLNPGHTFGALEMFNILKEKRKNLCPVIAEAQDLLFVSRINKDLTELNIKNVKRHMSFAALNPNDNKKISEGIGSMFDEFQAESSVLMTSLGNMSPILHTIPMLFNLVKIDNKSSFKFYHEGITPSLAKIMKKMDDERLKIGRACGINLISIEEWLKKSYNLVGDDLYELIQSNNSYSSIEGPLTLDHRFIIEDVSSGLVPMATFAKKLNVETPVMDSIISLFSELLDYDFIQEGRNINKIDANILEEIIKNI